MKAYLPIILCSIILIVGAVFVLKGMEDSMNLQSSVRATCLEHGYPDYRVHGNKGYCIRLDGGNQIVINVDDLEPK